MHPRARLRVSPGGGVMQPFDSVDRLERASALDGVAALMRRVVLAVLGKEAVRDALRGGWFGHPVHPVAVQVPIGTWVSASLLDAVPGNEGASTALVGTGVVAALPSIATGWADWSTLTP